VNLLETSALLTIYSQQHNFNTKCETCVWIIKTDYEIYINGRLLQAC